MHSTVRLAPAYSIGKKAPADRPNPVPGPGSYDGSDPATTVLKKAASYTMRKRVNPPKYSMEEVPGPGKYSLSSSMRMTQKNATSTSMHKRIRDPSGLNVPGPGTHDVSHKWTTKSPPKFTMRKRTETTNKFHVPGPGTHTINDTLLKKTCPSFSMGARYKSRQPDKVPDCGTYDPWNSQKKQVKSAPAYTMRGRFNAAKTSNLDVPGPGKYDLGSTIGRGTKLTMSKKFNPLSKSRTPDVGTYDPKHNTTMKSASAYSMRKRTGSDKPRNVPGPGKYEVTSQFGVRR